MSALLAGANIKALQNKLEKNVKNIGKNIGKKSGRIQNMFSDLGQVIKKGTTDGAKSIVSFGPKIPQLIIYSKDLLISIIILLIVISISVLIYHMYKNGYIRPFFIKNTYNFNSFRNEANNEIATSLLNLQKGVDIELINPKDKEQVETIKSFVKLNIDELNDLIKQINSTTNFHKGRKEFKLLDKYFEKNELKNKQDNEVITFLLQKLNKKDKTILNLVDNLRLDIEKILMSLDSKSLFNYLLINEEESIYDNPVLTKFSRFVKVNNKYRLYDLFKINNNKYKKLINKDSLRKMNKEFNLEIDEKYDGLNIIKTTIEDVLGKKEYNKYKNNKKEFLKNKEKNSRLESRLKIYELQDNFFKDINTVSLQELKTKKYLQLSELVYSFYINEKDLTVPLFDEVQQKTILDAFVELVDMLIYKKNKNIADKSTFVLLYLHNIQPITLNKYITNLHNFYMSFPMLHLYTTIYKKDIEQAEFARTADPKRINEQYQQQIFKPYTDLYIKQKIQKETIQPMLNTKKSVEFAKENWGIFVDIIQEWENFFDKKLIEKVNKKLRPILKKIGLKEGFGILSTVTKPFKKAGEAVGDVADKADPTKAIEKGLKGVADAIVKPFEKMFNSLADIFKKILGPLEKIVDIFMAIFNLLKEAFKAFMKIVGIIIGFTLLFIESVTNPILFLKTVAGGFAFLISNLVVTILDINLFGLSLGEIVVFLGHWLIYKFSKGLLFIIIWGTIWLSIMGMAGLAWLLDVIIFKGKLRVFLFHTLFGCENIPSKWYKFSDFHDKNINQRLSLFCHFGCASGFKPDETGFFCKRKSKESPEYCSRANIMRVFKNEGISGNLTYQNLDYQSADFRKLTNIERQDKINKHISNKKDYFQECDKTMKVYDPITKNICRHSDIINKDNRLKNLCLNTYCENGNRESFCYKIKEADIKSSLPQISKLDFPLKLATLISTTIILMITLIVLLNTKQK